MIKNWNKFNESNEEEDDDILPIGIDTLETQATYGLVRIFSPLESDMVSDWNADKKIIKWVNDKRVFLGELSYDQWEIYGVEGDKEVKSYIMRNYSW